MMRTCACLGVDAAIIEPAGFRIGDTRFRRAGMDYLEAVSDRAPRFVARFEAWRAAAGRRLALLTTKGEIDLWDFAFVPATSCSSDANRRGARRGGGGGGRAASEFQFEPPLRSLNVGVAAAIALVEALRQIGRLPTGQKNSSFRL